MDKKEILKKITVKKEFSQLPKKDVELTFEKFDKPRNADYQKIKLTRAFLRKIYSSFSSRKLLSLREREEEWVLRKHKSTKERLPSYLKIYSRIFQLLGKRNKQISIIDLGAGVNGFSYKYFKQKVNYIAVEAVGQLVDLTNRYFKNKKIKGKAFHFSLFELEKVKRIIQKSGKPRIIFLFKTIDSLEVIKRNYSKKLLKEVSPYVDLIVLSFATRSLGKRKRFRAQRKWILDFIKENFEILDDFETRGERYVCFSKK